MKIKKKKEKKSGPQKSHMHMRVKLHEKQFDMTYGPNLTKISHK